MSEYKWRVKKAWIGVMRRIKDERGLFQEDKLLGVIRRSGTVEAVGHFCFVDVQVGGKKYTASGAEDRIFPFHSIVLEKGEKAPELELEYVGWCKDHETPAFRNKKGVLVELVRSGDSPHNTHPIPKTNWPESEAPKKRKLWKEVRPGVFCRVKSGS